MTAIEFLKSKDPHFSLLTDTNQSHSLQGWISLMEEYAQQQVKSVDSANVVGRSELLLAFHKAIIPEDVVYNSGYTREEIVGAFLKRQ